MKKLEYKIKINASKKHVWNTMIQHQTYQEWVGASWPGSDYEGSWEEGKEIRFVSKDGGGTLAVIKEYKPYEYIFAEHVAILQKGGVEDRTSPEAKGWIGTTESYRFNQEDGSTELVVEIFTNPDWQKMFDDGWPAALDKLKELSERK